LDQDSLLVKRFKAKDLKAFDEIFALYNKQIYYYIYKLTSCSSTAEDITQDTFVKVYKGLSNTKEDIKLAPWIYRIAYNTFIDYTRRNKIKLEYLDGLDYDDSQFKSSSGNPEESYMNTELRSKINKTMNKLNYRYKSILILRDYNNLSYKEIALVMDLTEAAVKSLIHRARLEFQRIFKELG
jgi:RNA polymerase sigma-70 factor (ECF subfamily)